MSKFKSTQFFLILLVIIGTTVASLLSLIFSREAGKAEPKKAVTYVETVQAKYSDEQIIVTAYGQVQPKRSVTIKPEVSGRIIEQSPNMVVGGIVELDEVLLRIDPRDYHNVVELEKATYERALFEIEVEKGRQIIAKREWEQIGPTLVNQEISEKLVLRQPHLKEKLAQLAAAKSRLEKAKIDLSRTVIKSPMKGVIISETTEVGDFLTPQSPIAQIVATDAFEVQLSIPVNKLKWLTIPGNEGVKIYQEFGDTEIVREGVIRRLQADLDPSGRMARLIVEVQDPLNNVNEQDLPLLLGSYVRVELAGKTYKNIIVLPREALREDSKVWIKNSESKLEIKKVNVFQKTKDRIFINEGIKSGDEIITSTIAIPIIGMDLENLEELKQ